MNSKHLIKQILHGTYVFLEGITGFGYPLFGILMIVTLPMWLMVIQSYKWYVLVEIWILFLLLMIIYVYLEIVFLNCKYI